MGFQCRFKRFDFGGVKAGFEGVLGGCGFAFGCAGACGGFPGVGFSRFLRKALAVFWWGRASFLFHFEPQMDTDKHGYL